MHPVMVLVAFASAALVTYAVVLAVLSATSALPHEDRNDGPRDRDGDGASRAPVPAAIAGPPMPPWVPSRVGGGWTHERVAPAAAPASDRTSRVRC